MGVDLGTYRARIGQFIPGLSKGVSHSTDIVFILFGLTCGALIFIKALLVAQGIESNPGPWTCSLKTFLLGVITVVVMKVIYNRLIDTKYDTHQQDKQNQQRVEDQFQKQLENQQRVENQKQQLQGENQQRIEKQQQQLQGENQQRTEKQQQQPRENQQRVVKQQDENQQHQLMENQQQQLGENHQQQMGENQQLFTGHLLGTLVPNMVEQNQVNILFQSGPENLIIGEGTTVINKDARYENKDQPHCLIEQTKAWIRDQRKASLCVPTKALDDAKKHLMNNKVVVIRGHSGDGKTHIATELLHWLMDEVPDGGKPIKEPISVPHLDTLNTLSPHSGLAILIDDMFGFGGSRSQCDVDWWIQRQSFIKPLLEGDMAQSANCVIITIRNDTFNEFQHLLSNNVLFDYHQCIDLVSRVYSLQSERKHMLETYVKQIDNFRAFTEKELDEIINCSPGIGFPQCCRVFMQTPELHEDRGEFFRNPLKQLFSIIELKFNEQKQTALLYLLFSESPVTETLLFSEGNQLDKTIRETVEKAFSIPLNMTGQTRSSSNLSWTEKLQYLRSGLESLIDSFVLKENGIYRFKHVSIEDAVALLYGQVAPQGFLKNCRSSCLRYIVLSNSINISQMFVLPNQLFNHLYERIVHELDSNNEARYANVACMTPWKDERFLGGFFQWMQTNRNAWLSEHARVYQTNDKHSFVVYVSKFNCVPLLRKFVLQENPFSELQMKCALDEALRAGSVDTASFLLDKGIVKPDVYSCFSAIEGGKLDLLKKLDIYGVVTEMGKIDGLEMLSKTISLNSMFHTAKYDFPGLSVNAVDVACFYRHRHMLQWLLTKYPMLLEKTKRKHGIDILHIAAVSGDLELYKTVESLIFQNKTGDECIKYMKTVDFKGQTILHGACIAGSKSLAMHICTKFPFLLSETDNYSTHSLHYAAGSRNLSCYQALESLLLKEKTCEERRDFMERLKNDNESTVLHIASLNGCQDICMYLCQTYPSLTAMRNKQGNHCLHFASQSGRLNCLKALETVLFEDKRERQSILQTLIDEEHNTVLHIASMYGNRDICLYLCHTYPSLVSLGTKTGRHCLHNAAISENLRCYMDLESVILEGKTNQERRHFMEQLTDQNGNTVLDVAFMRKCEDICRYLSQTHPTLSERSDHQGFQ